MQLWVPLPEAPMSLSKCDIPTGLPTGLRPKKQHGFALLRELLLASRDDIYRRPSFLGNLRPLQTSSDLGDRGNVLYNQFSGDAPSPSKTLTTLASDITIWHKNCFCRRVDVNDENRWEGAKRPLTGSKSIVRGNGS